ncbi:MAG: histidine--tRNA ligase [Clostridia bacterium]|nr:histidine--tRNA ligase [Clostridia bacterium]
MKVEPRILPGFMELLPNEQVLFNNVKDIIKNNFEKFGFLPVDSPAIESSQVLLAKAGGETEKQIYRFNKGENDLCLRYDLTVPLARFVAAHYNELNFPFRRYQINKVYRGERPQKGRFREFYQCDIDVVGKDNLSIMHDAEVPAVMYNIFRDINIGDFRIKISNRKLLFGLMEYLNLTNMTADVLRIIDKFYKIGQDKVRLSLIEDYKLSDATADKIIEFILTPGDNYEKLARLSNMGIENATFEEGVSELCDVLHTAIKFGIPEDVLEIDLTIARGLDYYTGTVYETMLVGYESLGSICSGGRYENLAGFYTDKKLPGVGMSIGLTRLFYQLRENNLLKDMNQSIAQALIINMEENYDYAIKVAKELRELGVRVEMYLENGKMKNKISYADKNNIPYAIVIGEDEIKANKVMLKDMKAFNQSLLSVEEAAKVILG